MTRENKPDFERYMTALRCEEPDRVPLGDWHVDPLPKAEFLGRKIITLQDEVSFWHRAGFDFVTTSSGILEPVKAPEGMTTKGEAVHTEYGDRVSREWAQEHEGVIKDWESFEKYHWPTVDDFDLSKWDTLDKILPSGMKAILLLGKIYTTIWMFMGAETFFNALRNNEELIAAMFDKVGRIQFETFMRVIEHPSVGAVLNPESTYSPGTKRWGTFAGIRSWGLSSTAMATVRKRWTTSSIAGSMPLIRFSLMRWTS
jgi:uroporphyrinogen decarboxylase